MVSGVVYWWSRIKINRRLNSHTVCHATRSFRAPCAEAKKAGGSPLALSHRARSLAPHHFVARSTSPSMFALTTPTTCVAAVACPGSERPRGARVASLAGRHVGSTGGDRVAMRVGGASSARSVRTAATEGTRGLGSLRGAVVVARRTSDGTPGRASVFLDARASARRPSRDDRLYPLPPRETRRRSGLMTRRGFFQSPFSLSARRSIRVHRVHYRD